jgi:hypothetical protein
MQRVARAPNIAIAQLWVDVLRDQRIEASVQRYFLSSIAGDLPPDQCLPEIWVMDDAQLDAARQHLDALQHLPQRHWVCSACAETIDGGFEQCWNCGAMLPAS